MITRIVFNYRTDRDGREYFEEYEVGKIYKKEGKLDGMSENSNHGINCFFSHKDSSGTEHHRCISIFNLNKIIEE